MSSTIRRILVAGIACCALTACATTTSAPGTAYTPGDPALQGTNLQAAQKSEGALEHAFATAQEAFLAALPSLSPATRAQAKGALQKAYQGLLAARAALKLGDTAGVQAQVTGVMQLTAQVRGLVDAH